jgi:hypothetical protein
MCIRYDFKQIMCSSTDRYINCLLILGCLLHTLINILTGHNAVLYFVIAHLAFIWFRLLMELIHVIYVIATQKYIRAAP